MKPFDLRAALAGEPYFLINRHGARTTTTITPLAVNYDGKPVLILQAIDGTNMGFYYHDGTPVSSGRAETLMMAPKKVTRWVQLYQPINSPNKPLWAIAFPSLEEAHTWRSCKGVLHELLGTPQAYEYEE